MPRAPISSGAPLAAATARRNIFAGEQVGRSLSYLGASIGRTAEIAQNEQDNRVLLEARTHVSRAMNDAQIAAEDPATDPAEMLTGFDRSVTQAREDALHGVLGGDQRLGRALEAQTQDAIEARRLGIGRLQGRRLQQASVAALEDHLDEASRSIATTKDPLDAKATYAEAESAIEASSLDPLSKERYRQKFSSNVDSYAAHAQLENDPQGLLATTANAESWAKAFPGLAPVDRFTFQEHAQRAVDAGNEQARQLEASNLEVGVNRGLFGEKQIDEAFKAGTINGTKRTELILKRDELRKKIEDEYGARSRFRAVLSGDDWYDPTSEKDRKQVDAVFDREVLPNIDKALQVQPPLMGAPPEARAAMIAEFVGRTGIVPTKVRSELQGRLHNGTPEQAAEAADLVDRIAAQNPTILAQIDKTARETATQVSSLVAAGVPADTAVERVHEARKQAPAEREQRTALYRTERKTNANWLDDAVDTWGRDPKTQPDLMRGEFDALAEDAFLRTGDIDTARKSALRDIQTMWAETQVNGTREWMKYAPEIYYANAAGTDWIREQLVADVNKARGETPPERIKLVADTGTARSAGTLAPSYTVLIQDEASGEFLPVPDLGRWRPDFATSAKGMEAQSETQGKLDRARERRSAVLRGDKPLFGDFAQAFASLPRDESGGDLLKEPIDAVARAARTAFDTQAAAIGDISARGGVGPERFPTLGDLRAAVTVRRKGESDADLAERERLAREGR